MKIIILIICTVGFFINISAQRKLFLRVCSINDQRFAKGFYAGARDSSILLIQRKDAIEINYRQIGFIKTRRTIGHDMLVASAILAPLWALLAAASYEKPQRDDNGFDEPFTLDIGAVGSAVVGFLFGGITGTLVGGINGAVKHPYNLTNAASGLIINENCFNGVYFNSVLTQKIFL